MTGPTFIRKGEVGDWKNHFPPEMNEKFEAEFIEKMKEHGLEFDWKIHIIDLRLTNSKKKKRIKREIYVPLTELTLNLNTV